MKIFDEIKQYLPKYLSDEAVKNLFQNLKDFPENIYDRLYTGILTDEDDVFQGDGLRKMPSVKLPSPEIIQGPVMVLSNTCDTSFSNQHFTSPYLLYCPIVKLSSYIQILTEEGIKVDRITKRVEEIKEQRVTNIFYLPIGGNLPEDCIAFLDEVIVAV